MRARPAERQQNYKDLRERTTRRKHRREENLQRIIELQRERHLHSKTHHAHPWGDIGIAA